jgi:predicted GIY-YIG superfamily endonuclease
MNASQIISAIEQRVLSAREKKYSIWTIGVTADPERRKSEHGNP